MAIHEVCIDNDVVKMANNDDSFYVQEFSCVEELDALIEELLKARATVYPKTPAADWTYFVDLENEMSQLRRENYIYREGYAKLSFEVGALRRFGHPECTAMADEFLKNSKTFNYVGDVSPNKCNCNSCGGCCHEK